MNAPERLSTRPVPLIIALAGAEQCGRRTIGTYLKRRHGFAVHRFAQPLFDAVQFLYGVSPVDLLIDDHAREIERLGKSTRELLESLRAHAKATTGNDILLRRLVERLAARGEWMQTDVVITDISDATEVRWIRSMRGQVWWVRRPESAHHGLAAIERMFLELYEPGDAAIINDATPWALEQRVDQALARARSASVVEAA